MKQLQNTTKISAQGYELIQQFEGLRTRSYRDSIGVWTIGYGHTTAAGPPSVTSGMQITEAEAQDILRRDVAMFEKGVARLVTVPLTNDQFSALVSFAYNVGLGNFERSSVLKSANAKDFDSVPRRLSLWTKAGGRILPGLIRRRAAEAALFASGNDGLQGRPDRQATGKSPMQSRTILAALIAAVAAVLHGVITLSEAALPWLLLALIITSAAVIIHQRLLKLKQEGL
jgi:lysozyme